MEKGLGNFQQVITQEEFSEKSFKELFDIIQGYAEALYKAKNNIPLEERKVRFHFDTKEQRDEFVKKYPEYN